MANEWYALSNGPTNLTHTIYSASESRGALALTVTAGMSLCAVIAMLIAMAIQGFKTRHQFIRSQVGAYFLSLVISDLLQASGSVMNSRWVLMKGVRAGPFCTVQAALKQTGNVGTAVWSLVIATHTFCLLFLRLRISNLVFYPILIGVWILVAFVVTMGPTIIHRSEKGPFWGVSGYWCWITDSYPVEQLTNEYMFMFITAGTSFILYTLIFLRLRGNMQGFGWNLRFHRVREPWVQDEDDSQMSAAGKQMLWYPVAYTIIILPIAACRWSVIFGHRVPYLATMGADTIFMLSGFVNVILYSATRRIVSIRAFLPFSRLIRIGSPRTAGDRAAMTSKPSLEDMEFAIPAPPLAADKELSWDKGRASASPVSPLHLWHPKHIRSDDTQPPGLYKVDSASETSFGGQTSEQHVMPSLIAALRPPSPSQIGRMRSASDPPTSLLPPETCRGVQITESPQAAVPSVPSDTSIACTTDGAPSLHRKRFSGWSLPSVRGATSQEEDGDDETELEEMCFATPSPPRISRTLPPSHSASTTDLHPPTTRWPPRAPPLD